MKSKKLKLQWGLSGKVLNTTSCKHAADDFFQQQKFEDAVPQYDR